MKVVELLAEKAKINATVKMLEYYTLDHRGDLGGVSWRTDIQEGSLKKNYETAQRLLRRLDDLNNALFESDAKNYVDVMGNHLSVATARKYLEEIKKLDNDLEDVGFFGQPERDECLFGGNNLRLQVFSDCIINGPGKVGKDPLNLGGRQEEFKQKELDWYYGLKVAIAMSDAATEVSV